MADSIAYRGSGYRLRRVAPAKRLVVFKVTSILPTIGSEGTAITIVGTDFTDATAARVGGVAVSSFTVVNDTTITGVVQDGDFSFESLLDVEVHKGVRSALLKNAFTWDGPDGSLLLESGDYLLTESGDRILLE